MTRDGVLLLSDAVLGGLGIAQTEIADCIEAAVSAQATGDVWTVPKSALLPGDGRYLMTTLSASDSPQISVVKSVMVSPRNPGRGLPAIEGAILLQSSETGRPLALMEAGWVTAVRTAGLSTVAARRLADPASAHAAFIGAGVQARSHLDAFAATFPLERITVYSRGSANTERLCAHARAKGLEAQACTTPEEALRSADLVVSSVTLSFSMEPFIDAHWLKTGAFAAITDACVPWQPDRMSGFGSICIDDLAQEKSSANPMLDLALVSADLAGLITGRMPMVFDPGTRSAFAFRGLAIGDYAVACLAYERARAAGLGTQASWR